MLVSLVLVRSRHSVRRARKAAGEGHHTVSVGSASIVNLCCFRSCKRDSQRQRSDKRKGKRQTARGKEAHQHENKRTLKVICIVADASQRCASGYILMVYKTLRIEDRERG